MQQTRSGYLLGLAIALVPTLAAQDATYIGRIGRDTALVESVRRAGDRLTGVFVNASTGLTAWYYEAELGTDDAVHSFTAWRMPDLDAAPGPIGEPSLEYRLDGDSIRVTFAAQNGRRSAVLAAAPGVVPIFDPFSNGPLGMMDVGLRHAVAGTHEVNIWYNGTPQVAHFALARERAGRVSFPYSLASAYQMMAGTRLGATMGADGMTMFDASQTTFKIVSERRPYVDAMAIARDFRARGVGAGGFASLSPSTSVSGKVGTVDVSITYGQPSVRGRTIFGGVVPLDQVWRAGANAATRLTVSVDVIVGGSPLPAGSYSLWVIPGARTDTLLVNSAANTWGVNHDPSKDVLRVSMCRNRAATEVEKLQYEIAEGELRLSWADRVLSVTIAPTNEGE